MKKKEINSSFIKEDKDKQILYDWETSSTIDTNYDVKLEVEKIKYCPNCGFKWGKKWKFCSQCGFKFNKLEESNLDKKKLLLG